MERRFTGMSLPSFHLEGKAEEPCLGKVCPAGSCLLSFPTRRPAFVAAHGIDYWMSRRWPRSRWGALSLSAHGKGRMQTVPLRHKWRRKLSQ